MKALELPCAVPAVLHVKPNNKTIEATRRPNVRGALATPVVSPHRASGFCIGQIISSSPVVRWDDRTLCDLILIDLGYLFPPFTPITSAPLAPPVALFLCVDGAIPMACNTSMFRILTVAAIVMTLAGPAWAEETLNCVDKASNGFQWKDGKAKRSGFKPERFTVRVVSDSVRILKPPGTSTPRKYECKKLLVSPHILECWDTQNPTFNPIIFQGDRFARVSNFSEHVGGDPGMLVAYGTCTKF